jgi:transcriptional regulator with XRE-family HTH domain
VEASTLRAFRSDFNLTQKELAKIMVVNKQTISRWENNLNRIPRWVEFSLASIAEDKPALELIKSQRKPRIHGRPFQKKFS